MLLTPYIYATAEGRRHISNVKFNNTLDIDDVGDRPPNTTVSTSNNNVTHPNLTTPDILETEATYASRYFRVSIGKYLSSKSMSCQDVCWTD